jgi:serine/threonine protein kinase
MFSINSHADTLYSYAGSETNVPPEFITDRRYDISKEAVRSIGITIYQMLYGRAPYTDYKRFSDVISGLPQLDNISDGKCICSYLGVLYQYNLKIKQTATFRAKALCLGVTSYPISTDSPGYMLEAIVIL